MKENCANCIFMDKCNTKSLPEGVEKPCPIREAASIMLKRLSEGEIKQPN